MENVQENNEEVRTTMNISLTVEDKRFLKVYAAKNNMTVSGIIHKCIEDLREKEAT